MISIPQVYDCLSRGWIVVVPNHRLCPQVNIRDGPLRDVRDCLEWVYADDGLDKILRESEEGKGHAVDKGKVMAFGTSSGGMLACGLVGLLSIIEKLEDTNRNRDTTSPVHHGQSSTSTAQSTSPTHAGRNPSPPSNPNSHQTSPRHS